MPTILDKKDLPKELLELEGDKVAIKCDPQGKVTEISYSSAPELSYPSEAIVFTAASDRQPARIEVIAHAAYPDPADEEDLLEDEESELEDGDVAGSNEEGHFEGFYEWSMNFLEVMQYRTELWRKSIKLCSFCEKHQGEVTHIVAGPFDIGICNECVDLCEDVLAEEDAK